VRLRRAERRRSCCSTRCGRSRTRRRSSSAYGATTACCCWARSLLLLVTVGKVFLYDLAALTALYRVGSFIGLGLLLLVAAGLWQRMRPPVPTERARRTADVGDVPPAVG
jgi:hypothetical protein